MLKKIFAITLLLLLAANSVAANDFTVSFVGSASSERGARNLGIAFSDNGVHAIVTGKVQHESGWLVEGATGNANSQWERVDELAIGWSKMIGDNWLMRADYFQLELVGEKRSDETVKKLRLAFISTNKEWWVKPRLFVQQVLNGLPGEGTAFRPGLNIPFGESPYAVYAEATVHDGLFNQDGFTHSSNRFGLTYSTKKVSFELAFVDSRDTPVLEDRTAVQFTYKFK